MGRVWYKFGALTLGVRGSPVLVAAPMALGWSASIMHCVAIYTTHVFRLPVVQHEHRELLLLIIS